MKVSDPLLGSRLVLGITSLLLGTISFQAARELIESDLLFASVRWTAVWVVEVFSMVLVLVLFCATWFSWWKWIEGLFEGGLKVMSRLGAFNLLLFFILVAAYSFLILSPVGRYLKDFSIRLVMFWLVVLAGATLWKAFDKHRTWGTVLIASWLCAGMGYKLATFIPDISTYPFTLNWSEASRYYYSSLYFAERIYGIHVLLSPLHPSRYLMQAVPFLISGIPLWFHRFWQVFLWLATSLAVVYLLDKRLSRDTNSTGSYPPALFGRLSRLLFMTWGFLFLFQGPVYYHLLVIPIILFGGFDGDRFWKSLILVGLASAWAGISRINWYPMPGLLAAVLYFLEKDLRIDLARGALRSIRDYLARPVVWVGFGTLIAFLSQAVFILWSGIESKEITSSFMSDLLWDRWLPNATFPLGILPAILLVSAALLLLLWRGLRGLHAVRQLGLAAILFVLFSGGVIVSTKIGGGSNLHNLDAYLVMLWVTSSYVFFSKVQRTGPVVEGTVLPAWGVISFAVCVPVLFVINSGGYNPLPDKGTTEKTLATLSGMVDSAVQAGGEVLFMSERQLVTFNTLPGIPLVDKYEKVYLMEMAMAGNADYLNEYYADIQRRRFALIISDPMRGSIKGREYPFGEENDVWVERVIEPTLEVYQSQVLFKNMGIEVLAPKP